MNVLVIDDSPDSIVIARACLAKEGLDVFWATSGRTGLAAAKKNKPDLILLDVNMPDMGGFEVCRELKANPELCMIPLVFLTGRDSPEDRVRGLDNGAVDYVIKPFDAVELRARVRAALRTKRLQDLLIQFAHIDPLTGLGNRRALMERLHQEWMRIQRHGGSVAFVMADVDHFKQINDTHGHHTGDRILSEIAKVIMKQCREIDFPTRYGGDEFAIVLPNCDTQGATQMAQRCRRTVEEATLLEDRANVAATLSFGIADSQGAPCEENLVKEADEALYRAKQAGRNRIASRDEATHTVDAPD